MQLLDVYSALDEQAFSEVLRSMSIGKLKTYQVYERLKTRMHVAKLNTETLKKGAPRFRQRILEGDDAFAAELAQAILICHMDLIVDVLNFLKIPHEDGFFAKDVDAGEYLTEGWQQRVYDEFKEKYPPALLLFYINHLAQDTGKAETVFQPAA